MIEPKNGAGKAGGGYYRPYALAVASPTDGKTRLSGFGGNTRVSEWRSVYPNVALVWIEPKIAQCHSWKIGNLAKVPILCKTAILKERATFSCVCGVDMLKMPGVSRFSQRVLTRGAPSHFFRRPWAKSAPPRGKRQSLYGRPFSNDDAFCKTGTCGFQSGATPRANAAPAN